MGNVMAVAEDFGIADALRDVLAQRGQSPEVFFRFWKVNLEWASNGAAGRCDIANVNRMLATGGTILVNRALSSDRDLQRETLAHEIAHAIAEWDHAGSPGFANHNEEWAKVARALGDTGEQFATPEVSALIRSTNLAQGLTKVVAECLNESADQDCNWRLVRQRYSKRDYGRGWTCPRCGSALENIGRQGPRN